jgi:Zn-dependent protease
MDIANIIQTVAIYALPVLFAITVHEAAHGYAARHFGDNTAWMLGRITLNPLKHIDPVGTILMPLLLYFATSGAFLFGYAKPVPVRFGNLRNPKRDMIWVALAGPAANLAGHAWACWLCAGGHGRSRAVLHSDGARRRSGQHRDVCVQPVPAAAAGWRVAFWWACCPEAGHSGVARRALGLLHRDGVGGHRRGGQPVDAPADACLTATAPLKCC